MNNGRERERELYYVKLKRTRELKREEFRWEARTSEGKWKSRFTEGSIIRTRALFWSFFFFSSLLFFFFFSARWIYTAGQKLFGRAYRRRIKKRLSACTRTCTHACVFYWQQGVYRDFRQCFNRITRSRAIVPPNRLSPLCSWRPSAFSTIHDMIRNSSGSLGVWECLIHSSFHENADTSK